MAAITPRHVLYGGIAAAAAASVALDATLGKPSNWPLWHKLLGEDWLVGRNVVFALGSIIAAMFGYLTLNVKNGGSS
jgi:hypothetical protein